MRLFRFFVLIFLAATLVQCQREISNDFGNEPKPVGPSPITAIIQGNVFDETGQPAAGVNVKVGSKQVVTDNKGYFRITDASLDKNASLVTVEKQGYYKGYRTFPATSGANNVEIKLIKRDLTGAIDAAAGGTVNLNNGSKVSLPAGGVVVESTGAAYTGTVNVYAAYIDPTAQDIGQVVPGSFIADDENGGRVVMASFGMMAVELESASGEKLQIKTGSKATISSPIPASLQSSAPATIDLWYVDENTGIWKEEGSAQKNGSSYEGEVSHFSFWNYDIGLNAVNVTMTLKNDEGHPIVHTWVRLKATSPFSTFAWGMTDSLGQVSGLVPSNQPLELDVMDNCYNLVYNQNIGPFSQNTNLGNIVVTALNNAVITIEGTALDCSGNAVTDGFAMLIHNNTVRYAQVDANGSFNFNFVHCSSSSTAFEIMAVDANGMQQGAIVAGTISGSNTNVGNLTACGNSIVQFMDILIDAAPNYFEAPDDSLTAYSYEDSLGNNWITYFNGVQLTSGTVSNYINIMFTSPQASPTTGTVVEFSSINFPQAIVVQPFNVNLTSFANAPGEFYEGSITGTFMVGAATHTVNGTFRLRRNF